jgi:hypothetical protein
MIFSAIAYVTISCLSAFGSFELIRKCKTKDNEDMVDINNLTIEDVKKIKKIIDLSFNNLKKTSSNHDILEDVDVLEPVGQQDTSNHPFLFSYLPYIYSNNNRPGIFF